MSGDAEVVDSTLVHDRYLRLRVDTLRYASGREAVMDVIEHPGGVTIVPVDPEGRILFVRQYRHATSRDLLELPAGTIDGDEPPERCAERELQEETGFRPGRLERLGGCFSAPGYCDEYLHFYLATGLTPSKLEGDEEKIEAVSIALDDALAMVARGEIEDAKTLAGLLLYLRSREAR